MITKETFLPVPVCRKIILSGNQPSQLSWSRVLRNCGFVILGSGRQKTVKCDLTRDNFRKQLAM